MLLYLSLIVTLVLIKITESAPRADCSFSINSDLSEPQPLILNLPLSPTDSFLLPSDNDGTVTIQSATKFLIACPGGNLVLDGTPKTTSSTQVTCFSGSLLSILNGVLPFSAITCSTLPTHVARYTGQKCSQGDFSEFEIGFEVDGVFLRHILGCFDEELQWTAYDVFNLTKTIGGYQVGYPRPGWQQGEFYSVGGVSVDTLYTKNRQRQTINKLIGLGEDDTTYVQDTGNYYLSRGHLTAKADFVYGSQHRLTFYFINAAPQWQTFNGGNWNTIEDDVRNLASNRQLDLIIYTGTYGVTTLPHSTTGKEVPLYLYIDDNNNYAIPVPELYWKLVYDPLGKAGIVLIGVNNPYKDDVVKICGDIASRVGWLKWKPDNKQSGYGYACGVDDFRRIVDYLPEFEVDTLLV